MLIFLLSANLPPSCMAYMWSFSVAPQLASLHIWLICQIFKVSAHPDKISYLTILYSTVLKITIVSQKISAIPLNPLNFRKSVVAVIFIHFSYLITFPIVEVPTSNITSSFTFSTALQLLCSYIFLILFKFLAQNRIRYFPF